MNKKTAFLSIPYLIQGFWIFQIYSIIEFHSKGILGLIDEERITQQEIPEITQRLLDNQRAPQLILSLILLVNLVVAVAAYKYFKEKEYGLIIQHISSSVTWLIFIIITGSVMMALNLPLYQMIGKG